MNGDHSPSIKLPPDLLAAAEQFAKREDLTVDELISDAVRLYMKSNPANHQRKWQAIALRTQARAAALGIASEADVERLSAEYRREKEA